MAITVTTPVYYRLVVFKGANLQLNFTLKDDQGTPIDLSGCSAKMEIRTKRGSTDPSTLILQASTIGVDPDIVLGSDGSVSMDVNWSELKEIEPTGDGYSYGQYEWDFLIEYADGETRELCFYGASDVVEKVTVME